MYWPHCISYGRWGAPGLSGGKWTNNQADIPWGNMPEDMLPIDEMDEVFMYHDYDYQHGAIRWKADLRLVGRLLEVNPKGVWANVFRIGAIIGFGAKGYIGMLISEMQ